MDRGPVALKARLMSASTSIQADSACADPTLRDDVAPSLPDGISFDSPAIAGRRSVRPVAETCLMRQTGPYDGLEVGV